MAEITRKRFSLPLSQVKHHQEMTLMPMLASVSDDIFQITKTGGRIFHPPVE